MSKYFDSTRHADNRIGARSASNPVEVQEMLEVVTEATGAVKGMPVSRLEGCRKLRLPTSSDSRLIFPRNDIAAAALESYRALRTRLLRLQSAQGLRSIVTTSAMAGEGKTLTTMNLALCCAQLHDFRVLVIDSDLRTHGLTHLVGNPPGPGLGDILSGLKNYDDAIQSTDNPNLFVLTGGSSSTPAPELFARSQWKELMGWCGETFRLVLVDSPPVLMVADFEQIVGACDGVLVVVRALQTPREMLKRMALRVDPKKLLGAVFNGAASDEENYYVMGYTSVGPENSPLKNGVLAERASEEKTDAAV